VKYPKIKRTLAALTILGAGLIAVACGGNEGIDDSDGITGDGDGDNVDAELQALQDQIDDLEKLLEDTTNADAIASLEEQIAELKEELEKLTAPGCGQGGTCVGLPGATKAMEPVIEAVCSHLEGCCTASVMKFGLGLSVDDTASCSEALMARYTTDVNLTVSYGQLPLGFELPYLPSLAASLEQGRVEFDEDAIEACIDALGDLDCEATESPDCGENIETLCYGGNFFKGVLSEGALCSPYGINECEDGNFCYGPPSLAVCRENSGIGGPCLNGSGCFEGYCDNRTDTCVEYGQEGDDCSYQDPKGIKYPNQVVERCDENLTCSLVTETCISQCGDKVGLHCYGDWECSDKSYCDTSLDPAPGYAEYSQFYGACKDRVGTGKACTASNQCDSGNCDVGVTDVCLAPITIDMCSDDSDCETDEFCYGYTGQCLTTKFVDGTYCDEDNWCAGGLCTNGYCDSVAATTDGCNSGSTQEAILDGSRACPATDYCSYYSYTCTPKLALGADCSTLSYAEAAVACGATNYCNDVGECATRVANGGACDASNALSASSNDQRYADPCRTGSYCKVTDSRTDYTGKCTAQVTHAGA
jgi:hypothetical protein